MHANSNLETKKKKKMNKYYKEKKAPPVGVVKASVVRSTYRSTRKTGEIAIERALDLNATQQKTCTL